MRYIQRICIILLLFSFILPVLAEDELIKVHPNDFMDMPWKYTNIGTQDYSYSGVVQGQPIYVEKLYWGNLTKIGLWIDSYPYMSSYSDLFVELWYGSYANKGDTNKVQEWTLSHNAYTWFLNQWQVNLSLNTPLNLTDKDMLMITVIEYASTNEISHVRFTYGGTASKRYGCLPNDCSLQQQDSSYNWISMDTYYGYNSLDFVLYGDSIAPVPTPTYTSAPTPSITYTPPPPRPTSTSTPNPTSTPTNITTTTNYSYNGTGNTNSWNIYSNNTLSGWNNSFYGVFNTIASPINSLRTNIQSINSSFVNATNSTAYMPFLLVIVPAVVSSFPIQFKGLITLSLIFTVILLILKGR